MTRYFYTCPLAAAWMAKYFGMRFKLIVYDNDTKAVIEHDCTDVLSWPRLNLETEGFKLRYYIHPDSVGLLEPIEGDVIIYQKKVLSYFPDAEYNDKQTNKLLSKLIKIIQRNDQAFHWPCEEIN